MDKAVAVDRARVRYPIIVAAFAAILLGLVVAPPARALVPTAYDTNMWGANGRVRAIVQTPNAIYLAGKFTALVSPTGQTVARQNLAAIDPVTGQPLPFVANVNKQVWNVAVSPDYSRVYAVGDFTQANGVLRQRAAAFNAASGALLSWRANLNITGFGVATLGSTVYLGGDFTSVNGTPRTRLAAVDATTGNLIAGFNATANDSVEVITPTKDGSRLLIGGLFTSVSGSPNSTQRKMASLNPATGALQPWADHPNFEVFDIEVSDTQAFVAGGGSGGHAQAWRLSDGRSQWSAQSDGDAVAVEFQNGVLYVGGHFTKWKGVQSGHIVAVQPTTGTQIPWGITVNSNLGIFSMASFDGHLSIGGDFTRVNGTTRNHYARFSETTDTTPPTAPGKPSAALASPTSVSLTWAASHDNLITQIIYNVYRDGDTSSPIAVFTSASTSNVTFTDTALSPNSTHTWQVQASDGENLSGMSPLSDPFTLPPSDSPLLTSLQMLDVDANGRVDTVTAQFSDNISCTAPCLSPWTLANVPSNGSLSSVDVSGNTATLHLAEGADAPSTAVGSFTVALAASPDGIVGPEPNPASFGPTSPADKAGPVPVDISSANHGATVGKMEVSDTFTAVFSEPILASSVHAANVKELDVFPTDTLTIVGLAQSAMDLGESGIVPSGQNATYQNATLTLTNGNRTIVSTIAGTCAGGACSTVGIDQPSSVTFIPEQTLTDAAGNGAVGSLVKTLQMY